MVEADAFAPAPSDSGIFVAIDLIGDLDATLGEILASTLERLASLGGADLVVNCKHLSNARPDGIAALSRAIEAVQQHGYPIYLLAGSRKLRLAFKAARISCPQLDALPTTVRRRHVIIARHAPGPAPERVKRASQSRL
ncbi:MAG: hypothetical protein WAJ85_01460 [Candidatus Baltobacteraceae bacterium]|jgi:anti-anti-sigma regulatory factor